MADSQTNTEMGLDSSEMQRYARHLTLPEVGVEGQKRLKTGSVLMIGAGGLGSPAAMYLAAAGVGRLGIVDPDIVEASNLQRQLLYSTADIGRTKLEVATERIGHLNPHVQVTGYAERFDRSNAERIAQDYDLILDGTDNFATRYLSNDVAVFQKKPNIYGSIFRFEGQCSVFAPHLGGPCYRCMFPEPPEPGLVPSCAEGGVLGVLPGIVGSLQAMEAIKILLGEGESLSGRLLHFDAMRAKFREFKLKRDPDCAVCGASPTITEPVDYDQFCGGTGSDEAAPAETEIDVTELAGLLSAEGFKPTLLDVREPFEVGIAAIDGSIRIPLGELAGRHKELSRDRVIFVHCKSGVRSAQAAELLRGNGFSDVRNVAGGIDAWAAEVEPDMARY